MADNTTLNPGAAGDVIRDIQRSDGAKRQIVGLDLGGPAANAESLIVSGLSDATSSLPTIDAWDKPITAFEDQTINLLRALVWPSGVAPTIWSPFQELASSFQTSLSGIIGRSNQPSGVAPVMGAFGAVGSNSNNIFFPYYGRPFNIWIWGTFVAAVQIERSFDNGTNWFAITSGGSQMFIYQAPASETRQEDEVGVVYRARCTSWTSGTANYRLSQ